MLLFAERARSVACNDVYQKGHKVSLIDPGGQAPEPVDPVNELELPQEVLPQEIVKSPAVHDPYSAMRYRDFRLFFIGSVVSSVGTKMVEVALGWELYERTGSALVLGGVGLVLVIPVLLFSLLAGHVADRFSRKHIILVSETLLGLSAVGLTWLSFTHGSIALIYGCLFLMGTASAFSNPASSTLVTQLVPDEVFEIQPPGVAVPGRSPTYWVRAWEAY